MTGFSYVEKSKDDNAWIKNQHLKAYFLRISKQVHSSQKVIVRSLINMIHYTGQFTEFYRKVKKDIYFKELDFSAQSAQSLPRHYLDFKCF